ncbi:hypothetical protein POX_b02186 [Penicillium oxalicum]|uniref:hypothetical protein n=1 Tax=Penicillium oxalicum TaxID=69781 RepID=UPI0020B6B036|nr:hypothetical protein POX_b02186 [Penicillium oxalicum]KAI2792149.1 hypothetical protein POX_b02186 [Penicillium oxalicum]
MALSKGESDIILNRANVALARSQRLVASWLPAATTDELANTKSEEELQREEDEIFTAVPETLGVGAPLPEKAADGSWNRTELSSNDQLRKQLLGRNYDKFMKASAAAKQASRTAGPAGTNGDHSHLQNGKTQSQLQAQEEDEYDDDEEGRVSMVGRKNRKMGMNGTQKKMNLKRKKMDEAGPTSVLIGAEDSTGTNGLVAGDGSNSAADRGVEDADQDASAGTDAVDGPVETDASVKPAPSKGRKKATSYLDELLAERSKKRKKR